MFVCRGAGKRERLHRLSVSYARRYSLAMSGAATTITPAAADDALLRRYRQALDQLYGDRIERVILFGSRARGDNHADSDYDVAIFLTSVPDDWTERFRLARLRSDFLAETGAFFDAAIFPIANYRARTPIMFEIRKDGRDL